MSIHKLTAGSGYDYLTRQVAALDATHKGHVGLAAYYTAKGEMPGRWVGSGMAGIDGLDAGDVVTAEQMKALYGLGLHPLAAERGRGWTPLATVRRPPVGVAVQGVRQRRLPVPGRRRATLRPGTTRPPGWRRMRRSRTRCGPGSGPRSRPSSSAPSMAGRRRMPREISGTIAKLSRPKTDAVAGYDLTFSPVKSVSTLWAVADQRTSAIVESRPSCRGRGCVAVHRRPRPVHPDRGAGGAAGRRPRSGRGGVRASRQPGRGSGSAHPCRGREQGADPRRAVVVDRRPAAVQGHRRRRRSATTPPWKPT